MMMTMTRTKGWSGGPATGSRGRRRARSYAAGLALGLLAVSPAHAFAQAGEPADGFEWRGTVPGGGALEIKGVNGAIFAEGTAGSDVVVTARARGRTSDPSTVRIERVDHAGGITFCAVYPAPDGDRENVCAPGDEGRMSTRRNDVEVEFRVQVPAGVPFRGRTVNGPVEALDLEGDIEVETVNGDIRLSTLGTARAETVNGSIDARMGAATPADDLRFTTVNGGVTLAVPEGINADLDASWLNGGLDSNIPLTLSGRVGRRSARGALGQGGATLEIETVNGSIRIRGS